MPNLHHVGDLEIAEDMPFQERVWRLQRVGWAVFALIVAASALGLFGAGPLSSATAEQGPLRVEYQRFERFETSGSFDVRVAPGAAGATLELSLPHEYLRHVEVTTVSPQPREVRDGGDRLTYEFVLQDDGAPAWITFHVTPRRPGPLRVWVGLGDEPPVEFTQFVYP
jgi:hypothetical protein